MASLKKILSRSLYPSHFLAAAFLLLLLSVQPAQPDTAIAPPHAVHVFEDTVLLGDYFRVLDRLLERYGAGYPAERPLTEHLLIRYNPWVIDTLAASDYYRLKQRGIISLDPKTRSVFLPGQQLRIPGPVAIDSLTTLFAATWLDVNIPEFTLRIHHSDRLLYAFPVRVGRNERRYLAMAGREVDLRTRAGRGTIVGYSKDPAFINPVNNHRYYVTRRDDGVVTGLPNIPWLIPEIDGVRYGHLIHPTTNIETLGRAYSNGCIGTSEAAGWYLYYHAPPGTRIVIRYDLEITGPDGRTLRLPDIYGRRQ